MLRLAPLVEITKKPAFFWIFTLKLRFRAEVEGNFLDFHVGKKLILQLNFQFRLILSAVTLDA